MGNRFKSIILVSLQFLFILLLLSGISLKNISLLTIIFILLSAVLMLWAIVSMKKSKLSILPVPAANATLITEGPYRFIRHPMYTAILLGSTGLLIQQFTWLRLAILIALSITLYVKISWEEKMLSQKFDGYKNYMKQTKRIMPFII